MATNTNDSATYLYRLTFANTISAPKTELPELILDQGAKMEFKDSDREYYLTLGGVKINRKIYQPVEIEAELTLEQKSDNNSSTTPQAPSFSSVTDLLMRRMVKVDLMETKQTSENDTAPEKELVQTLAWNCFVYEMDPLLKRNGDSTQMYVKLNIFSMDKLMTLNKYSKAYVARKLGSEILQPESLEFGKDAEDTPLVKTDFSGLQFLVYKDGSTSREFIQPYLVQYNESFYDFLVRTSNRCGEFLFFEDGQLTLGLPKEEEKKQEEKNTEEKKDEQKKVEPSLLLEGYDSVTMQSITAGPMLVSEYARDSMKDGVGEIKDLNQTVIKNGSAGFPNEAFPAQLSANSELATDEYIFPLFKDKFSNTTREMFYYGDGNDIAMFQAMKAGKTVFANTLDTIAGSLASLAKATLVDHGVQAALSGMQQSTVNKEKEKRYIKPYEGKKEQYDGSKAVEFASLSAAGWTTLNYYNDIFKYEEAQQRQIVCVNMGTKFAPVKLGQKVQIAGLEGTYVVIQIQQLSEEAWTRDYEKYGTEKSDKFTGKRSLKIYCIPSFKKDEKDTVEYFVPPVQPVSVIRKSGPQTAYVTDNEDPKFQGRVRIAYPWQSEGSGLKTKIEEGQNQLKALETKINELKDQRKSALKAIILDMLLDDDLIKYVEASAEVRKTTMEAKTSDLNKLTTDVLNLDAEINQKKNEIEALKQACPVDEAKVQVKTALLNQKEEERKSKNDKKMALEETISIMNDAAKEHDQRKGKDSSYKKPSKDNSVIKKFKDTRNSHTAERSKLNASIDNYEKQKNTVESDVTQQIKALKQSINEMSSPWVRIATPMATPGGGSFYRPRVGDEVLVNFDSDNVERPYVVGSLFSKNVLTPDERYYRKQSPEMQWKDVSMAISSPNGHHISFTDPGEGGSFITNLISPGLGFYGSILGFNKIAKGGKDLAGGIHIGDRYGLYEIEMKSHKRAIEIKSPMGTVSINAFTGITISAPNGDVKIEGKNITLTAGNKVTINSGTNLPQPDFGTAPAGKTKAADITKAVIGGVGTALVDQFASSIVDLSTIRHIIEVFVRPVDGTTLIKSRKFLRLEAGLGNATIKRDRYKDSTKDSKEKEQQFYLELIKHVKLVNEKIQLYFANYIAKRDDYLTKRILYELQIREAVKNFDDLPDVNKWAMDDAKNNRHRDISSDTYAEKMKDSFMLDGKKYENTLEERWEPLRPIIVEYYEAALDLFTTASGAGLEAYFAGGQGDFAWLDKAAQKAAKEGWIANYLSEWQDKSGDLLKSSLIEIPEKDTLGDSKQKFFRRAFLLLFLKNVYDAPENKKESPGKLDKLTQNTFKYIYIGYKEADVTDPKKVDLSVDYWWKRQVHAIDRYSQNSLLRTLWDSTAGKLLNDLYDNTVGMFKKETDRQVWGAELAGQILFSDKEDSTLSFEGEGVHRETDANQGNIAHLKWMLRDL